jgi:AraC-like DNA-binding protein
MGQTRSDLLQTCIRLVDLLDAPAEIPFFSNLIHREIVYRLLQYPQGDRLRAIARLEVQGRGTAKTLAWLRANYMKTFRLNQLASVARMGISTLHHHFRAVTALSPLQYQKQLRLMGARERECSSRDSMPQERLSKSDMRAPVSSPANTNACSANRPCAMSKRSDSSALHPEAAEHAALLSSVSHEDLLNRKLFVHFPAPHLYLGFSRSKRPPT